MTDQLPENITCGEATIRLLEQYGVTTVFGIPGVHTLDLCRGLDKGVRHIQCRNEQGAGFMAEGWARATGEPGVAIVISGPGVTNAATAIGQSYCDSLPLLLISAEAASYTIGKGWGVLHEVTEQKKVTEPLTALSATARTVADVPFLLAQAFTIFASKRPRPVHISIPIDVQAELVRDNWAAVKLPGRPSPDQHLVSKAADLLKESYLPIIMVGGGAVLAAKSVTKLANALGAIVITSTAGKGIVPDDHPLSLSASTSRPEVLSLISKADVILAVGTELSETDSFVERMDISGKIIRVDIDSAKINDFYPAEIGIVGDANITLQLLNDLLSNHQTFIRKKSQQMVGEVRQQITANLTRPEQQHSQYLDLMRSIATTDTIWSGDACQLVYTGAFAFPVQSPRQWFYPAGYCALGNALPNAIGAKLARPDTPVVVLAGDGGFMFTMPELVTAAQLKLPIPIVIWENGGLKQIQDDMDNASISRVGVEGINPDFVALAKACYCHAVRTTGPENFENVFAEAFNADRPTVIVIEEKR
ncbi:MAG: 5-guanidino-2-oxopentanoate decarboxylase [Gammaproteobacteria bacterium]|jgi:5-guanidino-2-oxopentanoate decarboxylase